HQARVRARLPIDPRARDERRRGEALQGRERGARGRAAQGEEGRRGRIRRVARGPPREASRAARGAVAPPEEAAGEGSRAAHAVAQGRSIDPRAREGREVAMARPSITFKVFERVKNGARAERRFLREQLAAGFGAVPEKWIQPLTAKGLPIELVKAIVFNN